MTTLKWALLIGFGCYAGLGLLLYLGQRAIMYVPDRRHTAPTAAGFPAAQEVVLETDDGEHVMAWHVAPRDDKPVIIYFHGNGGSLSYRVSRFTDIVADGTGLIALSYRGYGGSSGRPTEAGLMRDAAAAYDYAVARYPAERLVLWGESLGSALAVALAAERPVAKIVLEAPFTSIADVAATHYWYFPVRLLLKDQFHSDRRIREVKAPVLILHGERDRVVPIALGERLFALVTSPKQFVRFAEGGHNDLASYGAIEAARAFMAEN